MKYSLIFKFVIVSHCLLISSLVLACGKGLNNEIKSTHSNDSINAPSITEGKKYHHIRVQCADEVDCETVIRKRNLSQNIIQISEDKRELYKMKVIEGLVYLESTMEIIAHNSAQDFIYVMDDDGVFYIALKDDSNIQHSSFFSAEPVASAGYMRIVNGRITNIDNDSDDYKPSPDTFKQAQSSLRAQGIDGFQVYTTLLWER